MRTAMLLWLAIGLPAPAQAAPAQNGPPPVVAAPAPDEPDAIPLYGDRTPGARHSENWGRIGAQNYFVRNVTRPTLTPVLPGPGKATGTAVIVAPGGAFMGLAISHEGWSVARALAKRGIAAFVLKYRLLPTPPREEDAARHIAQRVDADRIAPASAPKIANPQATEDGIAALALVRTRAAQWGVDPARVGMIGFSAGAMTAMNTALAPTDQNGGAIARPAFIGYIYGPQNARDVPPDAPPLFDAIAFDDPLFPTAGFPIAEAWRGAKRPVELHAYQRGSHGFGLGMPGTTTTGMIDQFVAWLETLGMLRPVGPR